MVKKLLFLFVFPKTATGIQQISRSYYICLHKSQRLKDRSVHMTFSSKMDDMVEAIFFKQCCQLFYVPDIQLFESIIFFIFNIADILQVPCIGKGIGIYYFIIRIFIDKKPDNMRTNKPCSSGN